MVDTFMVAALCIGPRKYSTCARERGSVEGSEVFRFGGVLLLKRERERRRGYS